MKKRIRTKCSGKWWTGGLSAVDVGKRLRIVPYWERWRTDDDRLNLVIDPGASFGSGDHPTTLIALELLEISIDKIGFGGQSVSVFDVGTGTGVLAIAAEALGSDFIVACDLDPCAVWLAQRNVMLNHTICGESEKKTINFYVGSLDATEYKFDVLVANLAAPVLLRLKKELIARSHHYLVLSGIPDSMFDRVKREFCLEKTEIEKAIHLEEWNGLALIKK